MSLSSSPTRRVLVLDADMIPCLSIVRSLARQGIRCDIASSSTRKTLTESSRYVQRVFHYADPLTQASAFVDDIAALLQQQTYDLVIPVTERSLIPLAHAESLQPWAHLLAIAPRDALNKVLDKAATFALAAQCDVPVPFSYSVTTQNELNALLPKLSYPVVLKPSRSIPQAEQRQQLSVSYAFTEQELTKLAPDLLKHGELLLQHYVQGAGVGIELLADNGEIVYAFQHQRLHEVPLTGGGSSLRKSVMVDTALLAAAQRLIKALAWHGVAMVEFKWQADTGEFWLMEINGRFWGSLPLACAAGADFPAMLYRLLVDQQRPATQHYHTNIYCRKLSSDIYWYEQILRRGDDPRLVQYPSLMQALRDALWALHPTHHAFDVQQWRDPVPGVVDLAAVTRNYWQRGSEIVKHKWHTRQQGSRAMQQRLQQQLAAAHNVLFVCYGNINRSALAHVLAQNSGLAGVNFASSGFHLHDNRPADANMVAVAAERGVDLTAHRSASLNVQQVAVADVILVMDLAQWQRIQDEYPAAHGKTFLLGTLIADQHPELAIADPYNQAISVYEGCFSDIQAAVIKLVRFMTSSNL